MSALCFVTQLATVLEGVLVMARSVPSLGSQPQLEKPLGLKLVVLAIVLIPFLGTLYAIIMLWHSWVSWLDVVLMLALYLVSGLGITLGFHRLLTHKSFETTPWLKRLLLICGCMAVEGDPIAWASTHIQHHAHADGEDDPHSPLDGLWHAHLGWLFSHQNNTNVYGTWLKKDRDAIWVAQTWMIWVALGLLFPLAIAGWSGLIWGGLVRIFLTHHLTWSVNSICHTFGRRDFQTRDASRNNFIVSLLVFGEGWHNNHHAFPRSAFHGLHWWQIDLAAYLIRGLERLGLVWNVVRVKAEDMHRRVTS